MNPLNTSIAPADVMYIGSINRLNAVALWRRVVSGEPRGQPMMGFAIPPGVPLRACACGARIVDVDDGAGDPVTVTYAGGPFPQSGELHNCDDYRLAQRLQAEAQQREEKDAAHCKGCGAAIRWQRTESGKRTPVNLDGSSHWESCPEREKFKKASRSIPANEKAPVETPALF